MLENDVKRILVNVLGLDSAPEDLAADSGLLGEMPEFDSMAVVSVLTAIEEHFDIEIDDDEVEASMFENVGTLVNFVASKAAAGA